MSKPNVVKRLNHVIQRTDTPHVDLTGAAHGTGDFRLGGRLRFSVILTDVL